MLVQMQLSSPFYFHPKMVSPTVRANLSTSVNLIQNLPHINAQRFVSEGILDPDKQTILMITRLSTNGPQGLGGNVLSYSPVWFETPHPSRPASGELRLQACTAWPGLAWLVLEVSLLCDLDLSLSILFFRWIIVQFVTSSFIPGYTLSFFQFD